MIESHSRAGDKPMEQHLHLRETSRNMFPTFADMDLGLWAAIVSLIVVLLPGIVSKLLSFSEATAEAELRNNVLLSSPGFNSSTLVIGFVLAVVAIACSKNNPSARLLATLTLVVCIIKFILPS